MNDVVLDNGKYRFFRAGHSLYCNRYGRAWRDFIGDHAVSALFDKCVESLKKLEREDWEMKVTRSVEMVGSRIRGKCPKCKCPLLSDGRHVWCTYIGSKKHDEPPCDFMLDIRPYEERDVRKD